MLRLKTKVVLLTGPEFRFCLLNKPLIHSLLITTPLFASLKFGRLEMKQTIRKRVQECSNDEQSRGPFQDYFELGQHGGKVATANKIIILAMVAVKFPDFEVNYPGGKTLRPPIRMNESLSDANAVNPKASLLCLSFRGSSQAMIDSWSKPFTEAFHDAKDIEIYQVSFIDGSLL